MSTVKESQLSTRPTMECSGRLVLVATDKGRVDGWIFNVSLQVYDPQEATVKNPLRCSAHVWPIFGPCTAQYSII
jgi:hypothetical protein